MDTTFVTDTLEGALSKYPAPAFFNSDQGSQYTSHKHMVHNRYVTTHQQWNRIAQRCITLLGCFYLCTAPSCNLYNALVLEYARQGKLSHTKQPENESITLMVNALADPSYIKQID